MKKGFFLLVLLNLYLSSIAQQSISAKEETPNIEVTGSAEMEFVPDEIFVTITLREKGKNSDKFTIAVQEDNLTKALTEKGFDLKNLSLTDANGELQYGVFRKDKVITEKRLLMKLQNAAEVNKLFQLLDDLQIEDAQITRNSHSQIEEFRKQVKISAVKAAKDKADYLLNAIGEQTGKPLFIREENRTNYPSAGYLSNSSLQEVVVTSDYKGRGLGDDISFTKIKIRYEVFARFSIK